VLRTFKKQRNHLNRETTRALTSPRVVFYAATEYMTEKGLRIPGACRPCLGYGLPRTSLYTAIGLSDKLEGASNVMSTTQTPPICGDTRRSRSRAPRSQSTDTIYRHRVGIAACMFQLTGCFTTTAAMRAMLKIFFVRDGTARHQDIAFARM